MKARKELESQLNLLLTGVAVNGIAHLEEVANDLIQTNKLLEEAINKLNGNFMALHEALQVQMGSISLLVSSAGSNQVQCEQLARQAEEVAGNIDSLVMGLQFQDMTGQLIGRALNRIDGLRLMLNVLATVGPELRQLDDKDMVGILESANGRLALQSRELSGQLEKVVRQQHMEGGSIELF